jgi:hypothetical protein
MVEAWLYAHRHRNQPIKLRDILALGRIIEPVKNSDGFRKCGVSVGYDVKMDWQGVPDAMDELIAGQPAIAASEDAAIEWFRRYEEIHGWVDGNGRSGSLLFNWILGTLKVPVHAPNLWSDPRRGKPHPNAVDPDEKLFIGLYMAELKEKGGLW